MVIDHWTQKLNEKEALKTSSDAFLNNIYFFNWALKGGGGGG